MLGDKARAVEEVVSRYREEPAALLTMLVELNRRLGHLPGAVLEYVSQQTGVERPQIDELVGFHELLDARMPYEHRLGICANAACAARGGNEVERILREKNIPFESLGCQGACDLGPIACYNRGAPLPISAARSRSLAKADPETWEDVLSVEKPVHAFKTEPIVAFANIFAKNSHQLATARRHGVYASVETALKGPPEKIFEAVQQSGLVGGTRAAVPAFRKWEEVRGAQGDVKYLVINADESEPGTFKDRIVLERDPHLLIAGAILAAYATGATEAFVYIRGEYEHAVERMRTAVEEASRAGLLGDHILGSGHNLRMYVRLGAGAYLPAEGTALLESLEGRVPRPREPNPPPSEAGLFGKPTLIHNVETLAMVPAIVANGGEWYRGLGAEGGGGMKIFSLCGDVKRPGNFELPRGTPIRTLVEELGEGLAQGKTITALMIGGISSPLLKPEAMDLKLSDDELNDLGACVGTGAVVVVTEKSCLFDLARRELAFLTRKSSGACEGCREGAREALAALDASGTDREATRTRIEELWTQMRESTRCGHAETLNPARSLLRDFPEAVDSHVAGECVCNPKKGRRS